MKNPPTDVAEAASDDPILGNSFDRIEVNARPEGSKGVVQCAKKLCRRSCVEFVTFCERQSALPYNDLDLFFVALLKSSVYVDDVV